MILCDGWQRVIGELLLILLVVPYGRIFDVYRKDIMYLILSKGNNHSNDNLCDLHDFVLALKFARVLTTPYRGTCCCPG